MAQDSSDPAKPGTPEERKPLGRKGFFDAPSKPRADATPDAPTMQGGRGDGPTLQGGRGGVNSEGNSAPGQVMSPMAAAKRSRAQFFAPPPIEASPAEESRPPPPEPPRAPEPPSQRATSRFAPSKTPPAASTSKSAPAKPAPARPPIGGATSGGGDDARTLDIAEFDKDGHAVASEAPRAGTGTKKQQRMVVEARETGSPTLRPDAATKPVKADASATAATKAGAAPGPSIAAGAGDPYVGKTIGGCRLERFLGRGGMGTVYYAIQVDLDRPVAFKILSPQLVSDPRQVAQFFREAKALAKVEHPNIVPIYNAAKEEEVHFLVMKLVEGGSLDGVIKSDGPKLPFEQATKYIEQAARGLLEAHLKGITHRDVKPENILVDGDRIMVTDFGLARMEGDSGLSFAEGRIVGTPYYMSPEQIDGRDCDGRTDIYALGATYYYMLTGVRPFVADTPVEILLKHVNEDLVPPIKRAPDIPESISKIIEKMLVKDRDRRYATLREFLRDLEQAVKGQEVKVDVQAGEKSIAIDQASIFEGAGTGSIKGSALAAAPTPVAMAEKPRSFYYALAGLGASTLVALLLGAGPIREIAASGAEIAPREIEAERALATLDAESEHSREGVTRLRKLAKDHPETAAAKQALEKAEALVKTLAEEAEKRLAEAIDLAAADRKAGKFAAALERLRAVKVDPEHAEMPLAKAIPREIAAAVDELASTRGQAYVPAGAFVFGENDFQKKFELPAFYVDLRETSNREWLPFVQGGGRAPTGWVDGKPVPGTEDLPVTGIAVRDALEFVRTRAGARKRLPNIYEWEKAARGVDGRKFPWGETFDLTLANQRESGPGKLEPADARGRERGAGPFGCVHMSGNAAEWAVLPLPQDAPAGTIPDAWVKGGAYGDDLVSCRAAYWLEVDPSVREQGHPAIGVRLVQDVEP